jgi:predicted protein tyrosine phosphatase
MKNYLFICDYGVRRSPTAAMVARDLASKKGTKINADSGTIDLPFSGTKEQLGKYFNRYDFVFAMDERIANKLESRLGIEKDKIINLDIEDNYEAYSDELITILRNKLKRYI